jgi:hypothetical protein
MITDGVTGSGDPARVQPRTPAVVPHCGPMPDVSRSASPTPDSDGRTDTTEDLVDIIANVRSLMTERNQAAEKARGRDGRRAQWG